MEQYRMSTGSVQDQYRIVGVDRGKIGMRRI